MMIIALAAAAILSPVTIRCNIRVTDGDTVRLCREKVRLLGIDAPEKKGHCMAGRQCVKGDPLRSTLFLTEIAKRKPVSITRAGKDRYGRTLATVRAGGIDLSCWQLQHGNAIYVRKWDQAGLVRAACPSLAR